MWSLEELKSIDDGGSFDLIVKETEKAANGDKLLKLGLLTDSVLRGYIDMHIRKAMERKFPVGHKFHGKNIKPKGKRSNAHNTRTSGIEQADAPTVEAVTFTTEEYNQLMALLRKGNSNEQSFANTTDSQDTQHNLRRSSRPTQAPKYLQDYKVNHAKLLVPGTSSSSTSSTRKRLADEATIVQDAISKLESKNSSSMKRGFVEVEEDKKKKKTTIKKTNLDDQRLPDPVIPQRFQDEIDKLKGTNVMLVGEKEMTSSDMDTHQGRFSIPRGKVRTHAFLREEDNPKDGVKYSLNQPCLQVITDMEFKKWTMNKTFSYTLIKKWNSVACNEKNGLQTGCVVQLWSFRVGLNLWFALVNLDLKQKQGEDKVASSSTGITDI
ncbi:hypothetical protein EZV62_000544 [Acer yangbiense]|uniref:TF-B3 domain-containing protein n=1 Tax=Acer yangbiense TaxID=1000413 RepID=A0A5C7IRX4_9ROSI|nr:hypothetical protein EZV62_000544 [Acer yangbiense]